MMKFRLRHLVFALVIIVVIVFVVLRKNELLLMFETMKSGSPILLAIAVLTQLGKYFAQSFAYSYAFAAVEEQMRARDTLPLVFGSFFMNTVAPSLNIAGMTLVIDDARQRGIASGKASSAAILMQMSIESGFVTIMLIGFSVLAVAGSLDPIWFLLGAFVLLMIAIMASILVIGHKRPTLLVKILMPFERLFNRILKRFKRQPKDPWAEKLALSFGSSAGLLVKNPYVSARVFIFSIVASSCELAAFILVGLAFGLTLIPALICGYVIATLFAMISITPQGVGVVEAAVMVLFGSFGIDVAAGLATVLVYRGLVFWMPFVIGAILIGRTKSFRRPKRDKNAKRDKKE